MTRIGKWGLGVAMHGSGGRIVLLRGALSSKMATFSVSLLYLQRFRA